MDFNQSFHAYDTLDGTRCQTTDRMKARTQKEAAVEAVMKVGLNQEREIDAAWFDGREKEYRMFRKRLDFLRSL